MRRSRTSFALVLLGCGAAPRPATVARCGDAEDALIASQADVARLSRCTSLHTLTIRSGGSLDLAKLPLVQLTGDLKIGPTVGLEDVALSLREVRGAIHVVGNGLMQGLFLRKLERAGAITVDGNAALTTIGLPALATAGALRVTDNASLELLDLAALTRLDGELIVTGAPRLNLLDAPVLHAAARVELDAPSVPAETAAALRELSREQ